jgi:hypothetical protein
MADDETKKDPVVVVTTNGVKNPTAREAGGRADLKVAANVFGVAHYDVSRGRVIRYGADFLLTPDLKELGRVVEEDVQDFLGLLQRHVLVFALEDDRVTVK